MFKDQALEKVPEGSLPVLGFYISIKTTVAFGIGKDFKHDTLWDNFFFFILQVLQAKGDGQLRKSM